MFLAYLLILFAISLVYFCFKAVDLTISLSIGDILLIALKIAIGLEKWFLLNKVISFLRC